MAREIPEAVRAAAGLAATVIDEARKLPETLPGLPVRVLGLAMQASMKVQQHYAGLVARGDELLTGIRGEDEPGLATFDDDEPSGTAAVMPTARASAFDRVAETIIEVTEDDDSHAAAGEALDELAIDELVDEASPGTDADALPEPEVLSTSLAPDETATVPTETLDTAGDVADEVAGGGADGAREAADGVDVLAPDGEIATVEATVTDEGVAAPEAATGGGSEPSGSQAPGAAPVDGYDSFSVAQLRGRLRGYALSTVLELLSYEQATRAREPYLRMLRNRQEKLEEQAVESSPLAPRGA